MRIADVSIFVQGSECRLIDTDRPVGQELCMTSVPTGTTSISNDQVPLFLVALGAITIGVSILVAMVAYSVGYRRACEDMSFRRPAGIIRRVDDHERTGRWESGGNQ